MLQKLGEGRGTERIIVENNLGQESDLREEMRPVCKIFCKLVSAWSSQRINHSIYHTVLIQATAKNMTSKTKPTHVLLAVHTI